MNIDYYTKISHSKNKRNLNSSNKKIKYLKNLITRILLSIILVLSICIAIKFDNKNLFLLEKYFFEDSLEFTKINKWYNDKFGKLIPNVDANEKMVFNSSDYKYNEYVNYLNGVKITMTKNSPISIINGGIVVFIGEKDGYGNTLIIQGNNGIDYWYGGITNVNVNLYDYLEKDTLIGETKEDFIYVVLEKNGEYLNYEEFINENKNK